MKLIRYGEIGFEKPGVQHVSGRRIDVSGFGEDYNELFFGNNGISRLKEWLVKNESSCPEIPRDARLGPPLGRPSKIICVGLNYVQHAKESGMTVPSEPLIFFKATSAIIGPFDDIVIPQGSQKTDWEVELAIVIGQKAAYIPLEQAMKYVAGYVLHNDISERNFQLEKGGQWVKGKSADTFAPLGPWIATKEEIADPNRLNLWLKVNGDLRQNGNTSDFVFDVPFLVHYISQFMTLLPGDIISTGTPSGVGMGLNPPTYLKPGDVVTLGVEGLGVSRQNVVRIAR